ncbi:MAG: extracellular solute-binding protein [Spirochaetales bacterium]|nr:extracellular solute-binding protein [Spirochaetales bacterium]
MSFSWFIVYDWFSPPNAWGADPVSGWLKENKNVDIDWVSSGGASADRLRLMIATEDLPDVICTERGPGVGKLIESGMVLPLDPYLDKMPNLLEWAGKENLEQLRHTDGKLYVFPNWYINPQMDSGNGATGWAVNTVIYNEMGRPPLATFDDLEKYLLKVKERYSDVVPMEVCDGFQIAPLVFRAQDENMFDYMSYALGTPENNAFTYVFKDPYVIDTYKYLSRLFRNKLITQDAFTQTRDQVVEKLTNARVAVVCSYDLTGIVGDANNNNDISEDLYDVIWPPVAAGVDPQKVTLSGYTTLGWNVNLFSIKAEDRMEEILTYLDWLTGPEGQRILTYGPKGYFWDEMDEKGIPFWNEKYQNATGAERSAAQTFQWNWVGNTSWVDMGKVAANARLPKDQQDQNVRWQGDVLWKTVRNENEFAYTRPADDSDIGMIGTMMLDLYEEAQIYAVFAESDEEVEQILNEYHEEMINYGYDEYLAHYTELWQNQVEKIRNIREGK